MSKKSAQLGKPHTVKAMVYRDAIEVEVGRLEILLRLGRTSTRAE